MRARSCCRGDAHAGRHKSALTSESLQQSIRSGCGSHGRRGAVSLYGPARDRPAPPSLDHRAIGDVPPPFSAGQPLWLTVYFRELRLFREPIAYCRIFESARLVAILLISRVEIRQWPLRRTLIFSTNSANGGLQVHRSVGRKIANGGYGSFAHCRIFESGRSAAILLTPLVEIPQRPLAPNSVFLDEFSERPLTKYTGQSVRKPPTTGEGRSPPLRLRANVSLLSLYSSPLPSPKPKAQSPRPRGRALRAEGQVLSFRALVS